MKPPRKDEWDTSLLAASRRVSLDAEWSFEQLAKDLSTVARVLSVCVKPYRSPPKDAPAKIAQVVYRLAAPAEIVDRFYNGRDGLRGRYWQSATTGDDATRLLLSRLCPALLASSVEIAAEPSDTWAKQPHHVAASLAASSSKIWICERNLQGEFLLNSAEAEHLVVPRWSNNQGAAGNKGQCWRWTPCGGDLEVKGGLIGEDRREFIPESKVDRGKQICCFGFT